MYSEGPPSNIRTIRDLLEVSVAERPDETFLQYKEETYTLADIDEAANAIANEMLAQGVEQGDFVNLLLYNSPEYLFTLFALGKIGAVAVPIDTRFRGDPLVHVLSKTEADTIIVDEKTREAYETVKTQVPDISKEYLIGNHGTDELYRRFEELLAGDIASPPVTELNGADPFTVTYIQRKASARPTGVTLPHFSYINTGWETSQNVFGFSESDCVFTPLPLYSATLQLGVIGAMLADAEFAFEDQFEPAMFWDQTNAYGATAFLFMDRMLSVLYNQFIESSEDVPANSIELAIGNGFGMDTDEKLIYRFEDAFDITVLEGYGITATATVASYNRPDDRRIGSVGQPVSYAQIEIVDENDWPVEMGDTGEIVVRPTRPNSMLIEHHDEPAKTVATCRNQWVHTNDFGYMDEDGFLYFVASKENTIDRGRTTGRISSLEIESIINSHPNVRDSAVVGVTDELEGEEIKAVVVLQADENVTAAEICRHCEMQLPYLKIPRYIEFRESLPRSRSGKVQKTKLREANSQHDVWDREASYELNR